MLDLKLHVFNGNEFRSWRGGVAVLLIVVITLITAAGFFLNAVFAFAIAQPGTPQVGPAFARARRHLGTVLGVGVTGGVALGVSMIVVPRWGIRWFTLSLGIVIAVMMFTYVAVPARVVGIRPTGSRRDRMAAAVIGGTLGALVCAPPYVIGRLGILLLGSHRLYAIGIVLLLVGLTLQAGVTGAVKAVKMSAKLATGTVIAKHAPLTGV
jgi:hypothetical protein